ncbi:MAG: NHL domain-containing protein [Planctomycetota bacterium]
MDDQVIDSTYWRFETDHFTPWDCNWPFGPPDGAIKPNPKGEPDAGQKPDKDDPCEIDYTSSYVERKSRIFHEDVPVPGTDFTLHYASNRVKGYKTVLNVPVSGDSVPASLKEIKVTIQMAGQVFEQTLAPLPDQKIEQLWDGLDYLGNTVTGSIKADVSIGFVYDAFYYSPVDFEQSFAQAGSDITAIKARQEIISWKRSQSTITVFPEQALEQEGRTGTIAEGWTLSVHHSWLPYYPGTLYKGDGTSREYTKIITTVAGNGQQGYSGDGGLATEAELDYSRNLAFDSIGNMYIADTAGNMYFGGGGYGRIRMVDTNGIITTVAGNGEPFGDIGDGGPATEARFQWVEDIVMDNSGNIYICDLHAHRIRKVDTNGIIITVAGNGQEGYSGDGGPATEAKLRQPNAVAVDNIGNIYISHNTRLRKVDTSGIITTVAGNGQEGYSGDGGPATEAMLDGITGIAIDSIGNIYISEWKARIREVYTNGIITTVIGNGQRGYSGDGGPATEAELGLQEGIAVDSAGDVYLCDPENNRIRKVSQPGAFTGPITAGETAFTDENGLGYVMDSSTGLHKSTINLSTGKTLLTFGYNEDLQLETITDRFGNQTSIQRGPSGVPTSITSPDGIVTVLTVDGNNHLTQVTYPDTTNFSFTYDPGGEGLMTDEYDRNNNHFVHVFDGGGKVTDVDDPEGGTWDYDRTVDSEGNVTTTVLTGEGNLTTYLDHTESTGAFTSVKTAPNGSISTITRNSDGITETNELSCGMTLDRKYDIDSEYRYRYLKDTTQTSPNGLAQTTTNSRTYVDTDTDEIPDLITDTVTINGKSWISANNTLTGMITNTSPLGRVTTLKYNTTNLLTEEVGVTGLLPTTFSYDSRGRVTGTTIGTRTATRDYDANGYLDFIITPDNKTYDYTFDVMGRLTHEDRPEGISIDYDYDANGNMTLLVTPKNISHTFDYIGNDQRKDYTPPISGIYTYVFDKERKLKTLTFPSNSQIENTYTDGLLTNTLTPEGSIDFTYECTSFLSGASMGTETVAYTYDGPLLETDTRSGILNKTISYSYDNNHRLSSMTYAGGNYVIGYDEDSLLTSAGRFTITRNTDNGLPEAVNDGTLSQMRGFNGYGEIDNYSNTVNAVNVYDVSLTRDNSGRIIKRIEVIGVETITWDYVYDDLGRLEEVKQDNIVVESYEYDANGNRTLETNTMRGIANKVCDYSNEDHIITAGSDLYVFDEDGFLVDRVSAAGTTTYDYSLRGELLSVDLTDGRSITYDHGPMGRRIAKKIDGTVVEKYLWRDNTTLLAVYDGSNNLTIRFNYANGRLPISMLRGGITYYMIYDQVGTLRLIVDSAGNTTKRIDYDSFGNIINDTTPGFTIPFGFAGGLHDIDTGLVRFGARDYDTSIGRWTAKDPIDFAGGDVNLYGYVQNNPVNWIDPLGLKNYFNSNCKYAGKPWAIAADVALAGLKTAVGRAAIGLGVGVAVGTIVEDVATAGLGITDDPASLLAAYAAVRKGADLMKTGLNDLIDLANGNTCCDNPCCNEGSDSGLKQAR